MIKEFVLLLILKKSLGASSVLFSAPFQTKDTSRFSLLIDFDGKEVLISENEFICNEYNDCNYISDGYKEGTYNGTRLLFKLASVRFYFDNKESAAFLIKLNNEGINALGVAPDANWRKAIESKYLIFDLFNSRSYLENSFVHPSTPLDIDDKSERFFLISKMVYLWKRPFGQNEYQNSEIKLQFPKINDKYDGNYFFLMDQKELNGWETFLKKIVWSFSQYQLDYTIFFKDNSLLVFDNDVFQNYDRSPFKLMLEEYNQEGYVIGNYFLAKSKMKLVFTQPQNERKLKAWAIISQNSYWYELSFSPIVVIQVLIFIALSVGFVFLIIHCLPVSCKSRATGDYESI